MVVMVRVVGAGGDRCDLGLARCTGKSTPGYGQNELTLKMDYELEIEGGCARYGSTVVGSQTSLFFFQKAGFGRRLYTARRFIGMFHNIHMHNNRI